MRVRQHFYLVRKPVVVAVLVAIAAMGSGPGNAAVINWVGPNNSFWDLAANWNPGLPGVPDDVLLGAFNTTYRSGTVTINTLLGTGNLGVTGGQLTLNSGSSIGSLTQSNGSVAGTSNLTVTGGANISFGDHRGTGTTILQGASTITSNGFRLDGGRVLRNEGQLAWSGGQILFNHTFDGNPGVAGSGTINNASGGLFTVSGDGATSIAVTNFGGTDTGADAVINNAGTFRKSGSSAGSSTTVGVAFNNTGLVQGSSGVLAFSQGINGNGTLQIDSAGAVNLGSPSSTGVLAHNGSAPGSLALGTNNITVSTDYTNANFGTGNFFNRRAGVSGSGLIVAGGNAAQAITGAGVSNGNTANASLTIGNVRVGATTFNYQVTNTGTTGPSLRGAIQTNVNGGTLTDARLSGAGVTASNYNTGAPGSNTGNLGVTFTAASAGLLAPLSGQALNLRSNFENIADQRLNILLAGSAAAYNAAVGSATPSPVTVANQRIGGSGSTTLTVANTATAGGFSEDLNASFGTPTVAASGSGSIAGRLAGTNNTGTGSMTVAVNTASAGAQTGTVTLNYQTAGAVNGISNGLGTASVGSQTINVSGNVYQAATGAIQTAPFSFGTLQVGQTVNQSLVIRNTATGTAGFVEDLIATFGASGNSQITGAGSLNGILAGANSTGANGVMTVTVTGATAGALNSNIGVNYTTSGQVNGVINGLGAAVVGSENYGVNGLIQAVANVINQASPQINNSPINLGNVRVNAASPTGLVSVTNVATVAPQAALNAIIGGATAGLSASGSFNLLSPGATNNSSLQVGMNTGTSGNKSGTATISFVSDANNVGNCAPNCQLNLTSQNVTVNGNVYQAATGAIQSAPLNFGTVQVGQSVSQSLLIRNTATGAAGFVEDLNASFGSTSGTGAVLISGTGTLSGILAGTNSTGANGSMLVSVNTAAAGTVNGNIAVNYQTAGAVAGTINGLGTASAGSEAYGVNGVINATANVINQANALVNNPNINLGAVRVGAAAPSGTVSVTNVASTPPQAALNAVFASTTGPATASGSFSLLAPGATNNSSLNVGLNTGTAGNFTGGNAGTATISFVSDANNVGNCSPNCQLTLTSQTVSVSGKVYTAAVGLLNTAAVNFGIVRVGDVVASQNIGVQNTATVTALNDTLRANLGGVGGVGSAFTGSNTVGGVTAGGSGNISVGLNTVAAGIFSQNGAVSFLSQNPDMADVSAGANQPVLVTAQVNNHANGAFSLVSGLGALTLVGTDWVLDLGNVALNSTVADTLKLKNDTTGPADDLSGVFNLAMVDDFVASGFGPVSGLGAGQSSGNLNLNFAALSLGMFQDIIDFDGFGTNASDLNGVAQSRRLIIRANVFNATNQVPEPGTLALLLVAVAAAVMARRRRIVVK